jgi:putative ABC transport system permease protein
MPIWILLRVAGRALSRNVLRSSLTMLGVIIGVAAVIATLAIGEGAKSSIQAQIASLGSNVVMVMAGSLSRGGVYTGSGTQTTLTEADVRAVERECQFVDRASPAVRSGGQVVYGAQNWSTSLYGADEDYADIRQWSLASGVFYSVNDVRGATKVCVLGQTVARQLFGDEDPVGKTIRIRSLPFRVVGLLAPKGTSAMGQDQDDIILLPYTTVQKRLMREPRIGSMILSVRRPEDIPLAVDEVSALLRQRHHIQPGQDDDFFVRSQQEISEAAEESSHVMTVLLGSIGAVSLLVGGIGIMNIMLVSVTERTREIGIRLAVGAKGRDILLQFLSEAAVLSLAGGLLGVALGFGVARIVAAAAHWPTLITPQSVILAFAFAAAVGIFFGYYPAVKASRQDPIEALRYE